MQNDRVFDYRLSWVRNGKRIKVVSHRSVGNALADHSDLNGLGQSGFDIRVVEDKGRLYIRKEAPSGDTALAERLHRQFLKHSKVSDGELMAPLLVPEIKSTFEAGGYSMAYVPGRPLGYLIPYMSQSELRNVGTALCDYFNRCFSESEQDVEINLLAISKLNQLRDQYLISSDSVIRELGIESIESLIKFFENERFLVTPNHGDFSFENILSDRRGQVMYALDFLDSPVETVLIDIGRLWLDLKMGWWASRTLPSASSAVNMSYLRDLITEGLAKHELRPRHFEVFSTFAALRVIPYTSQPFRLSILKNALRMFKGVL